MKKKTHTHANFHGNSSNGVGAKRFIEKLLIKSYENRRVTAFKINVP